MAIKALQFIHAVARKQAAKQSGKGITSIVNRIQAEAKAGEIAETFRLSGIPLEKLDDFIKSEKDVLKYLNIIESSKPVTKEVSKDLIKAPRKKGEVFDLTGKKIDTSKPILGGKNVSETEAEIAARLTKQNKEAIERLRNKEGPIDWDEVDKIDPEDFADGGVAGMLGERVGYQEGKSAKDIRRQDRMNLAKKSFIKLIPQFTEKGEQVPVFSKTGKQQIEGALEGITSDKEVLNLIVGLDIPITEKINILGDIGFSKYRDRIEKDDQELFLADPAGNINKNIGIGYEDDGLSGSIMYNPDTKYKQFQISKKFADGGVAGLLGERVGLRRGGNPHAGGWGGPGGKSPGTSSSSSSNQGPAGGASAGGNYGGNVNPNQTYGGGGGRRTPPPKKKTTTVTTGGASPFAYMTPKGRRTINTRPEGGSFIKRFIDHDRFTDMMKVSKTPNYHQMGGLDFMMRYPNINPNIAKGLATAYQNIFEYGRAVADGPGGITFEDAGKKAAEEARLNAIGIDAFSNPDSATYKQYTDPRFGLFPATVQMADGGPARQNFAMGRRAFMKLLGGAAAGIGALKTGILGFGKGASKQVAKDLTQIPIQNAEGMPSWFKPLVNRVIKEGTETTNLAPNKGGAFIDRQIVHSAKLGEGQGVRVYQSLDDQTIRVEYQSADNMGGVDDVVHLEYAAPQVIEPPIIQGGKLSGYGKGVKTKAEFSASEAYPLQDPKDYKTITFEGDNTVSEVKDLISDTSALKQFGTNKALTKKELEIAKQKRKRVKEINEDPSEELAGSGPDYDPYEDFASGGRVSFKLGGKGKVLKGLAKLMDEFFPGTTKLGQRSKSYPEKVQEKMGLRKAFTDFQERQKNKKLRRIGDNNPPSPIEEEAVTNKKIRETINADEKAVAKLRKEHKEKYGKYIYHADRSDEINKQSQAFYKKIDDLQNKIDKNRYLVDDVVIDGKKYKLSDKDRPPTKEELEDDYAELWDDEHSPWDYGNTRREMDAALAEQKAYHDYMYDQYKIGKLDPEAGSVSRGRLELLRKRADEAESTKDFRLFGEDEADELAYLEDHFKQVDKEESLQFAERIRKAKEEARANKKSPWYTDPKTLTPEEELRREFPGISDDLIKNILVDDNPQRIAEVKATMKEALKMQQKGMGPDEIINIFKKKPTKHASGGIARMLGE